MSVNGPVHRVERLPLREVWPREQQDFSAWLVENIDILNEHLPFILSPDSLSAEQAAGRFFADIVADADSPDGGERCKVVIENQLETTDHDHLGKLITYAAAFDARAVVWISGGARPEHARAVQWLNDETSIDAWLFELRAIRIAESPVAPMLIQIIGPSELGKEAKAERQAAGTERASQAAFWEVVLPRVAEHCRALGVWQNRRAPQSPYVSQTVPGAPGRMLWQMWVTQRGSWICLRFEGDAKEEADFYFASLQARRREIEERFGEPGGLRWDALPEYRASRLTWENPTRGGFLDEPDQWTDAAETLADGMRRLIEATWGPIKELPSYAAGVPGIT
jgi:hypothetical protein